jgi:type IV pilus assembly protein PilB
MARLIDALLEKNLITREQLQDARDKQIGAKKPIHELLIEMGFLQEEKLVEIASNILHLPVMDLENESIDTDALKLFSYEYAKSHGVFPVKKANGKLFLAMSDPQDISTLEDARIIAGMEIQPVLCAKSAISKFIEKFYLVDDAIYDLMKNIVEDTKVALLAEGKERKDNFDKEALKDDLAPVVRIVNLILSEAVKSRASDIHIEPFDKFVEVRYRVDGFLKNIMKIPKRLSSALIARIKILSDLDIAETRKSQDGRIKMIIGAEKIDLRISIMPAFYGEKAVIRVLDARQAQVDLTNIGFQKDELDIFKEALHRPQGMILITGPTGSGKTSTIYAALSEIKDETINIITIEDPVEYLIEGISQIEVNPVKDVTFATGLRSILRQDPNVILVGEIRDKETADIAFRSSLTGHLVFSTLHTNNAVASIIRLRDIGLDPYIIASSLALVVSQRLVRVICPHCKQSYEPESRIKDKFKALIQQTGIKSFYQGKGCEKCNYNGFAGRTAIFEVLKIDGQLKELISNDASESEIFEQAKKSKFKTLAESGILKVSKEITTLEEIDRVTDVVAKTDITEQERENDKATRILIVDDEDDIRKVVAKRINAAGYETIEAANGQEAVEMVFKEAPDLIIIDLMMPVMGGIEATKKIKSNLQTASIPIMMLTAKQDKASELQGIDSGADDYITKPFDNDKLIARVKMLLRRRI